MLWLAAGASDGRGVAAVAQSELADDVVRAVLVGVLAVLRGRREGGGPRQVEGPGGGQAGLRGDGGGAARQQPGAGGGRKSRDGDDETSGDGDGGGAGGWAEPVAPPGWLEGREGQGRWCAADSAAAAAVAGGTARLRFDALAWVEHPAARAAAAASSQLSAGDVARLEADPAVWADPWVAAAAVSNPAASAPVLAAALEGLGGRRLEAIGALVAAHGLRDADVERAARWVQDPQEARLLAGAMSSDAGRRQVLVSAGRDADGPRGPQRSR